MGRYDELSAIHAEDGDLDLSNLLNAKLMSPRAARRPRLGGREGSLDGAPLRTELRKLDCLASLGFVWAPICLAGYPSNHQIAARVPMATIAPSRKLVTLTNVFTVGRANQRQLMRQSCDPIFVARDTIQEGFGVS
jgi:hypothetical protein